jgi:hypothetical protein
MIIEHYIPTKKTNTNIISTDQSRLSFIIMQKFKKGKTDKLKFLDGEDESSNSDSLEDTPPH